MRLAVAVLFVMAACALFLIQTDHCTASLTGNQTGNLTGNLTGNHTSNNTLNNVSTVNNTNHTNNTYYQSSNQTNPTRQNDGNLTDDIDDDDYGYDYNAEYNNYYDDSYGEDNNDTEYYDDGPGDWNGDYQDRGAITGVILSSVGSRAVPDANVALLDEYGYLADVPANPQLSSNGTGNNAGVYMFYDVPYGHYTVTAEKGGVWFFAVVNLSSGTATANVVLPEYVETEPAYQEPLPPEVTTPTPRPMRYFIPITVGKTPATPGASEEGLPFGLAAIGSICALFLFTRRNGKA